MKKPRQIALHGAFERMVSQGRFELPTFPLGGGCSIQLSYWDTRLPL